MAPRAVQLALLASVSLASFAACTVASPTHLTYNAAADSLTSGPTTKTCDSPFAAPDLAKLKACRSGESKGHCYAAQKVPTIGELEKCDDGKEVCVPDAILTAAGKKRLRTCNSVINTPGACVSLVIKDLAKNAAQLTKDVCEDGERCIPCVNPLDKTDTPFCADIGVHEADCEGGDGAKPKLQACCLTSTGAPAGVCMERDGVPEEQRDSVIQDLCAPGKACVPKALVDGEPVRCDVGGGVLGGVCVDKCFMGAAGNARAVLQSGCGKSEVCVPCLVGKGQGLPGCD